MIVFFDKKSVFFLSLLATFMICLIAIADTVPDPILQYNQDGSPYIAKGGTPSGNVNDLNSLGEGLTYNIPEVQDGAQETKLWNITPTTSDRQSTDVTYGSCTAEELDTDNSDYCGDTLGIDRNEYGYVNSTHSSSIPSDATITDVTVCWSGYFETGTNDNVNDASYIRIGENSSGSWAYTNVASCSGTTCNFNADTTRCYDVTSIFTDVNKASHVRISLYHIEGDDNNRDIFDDYNYVNITYTQPLYSVDVWHNSSQIDDGNINSINATLNFTTNVSDDYSLMIYDWFNSQWASCNSGSVPADTATKWWCNITSNPMNYNTTDRRVRIGINSTADLDVGLLSEDYVQYYVGYPSYLEVNLTNPSSSSPLNVGQNKTFNVNATVVCKNGPCGEVFGTIMYNLSSQNPDTYVNTTQGDKPLFIQESPASAEKSCGNLYAGDSCQLNWTINATGDVNTDWKIGVLFNSTYTDILVNNTNNATISIFSCTVDFDVTFSYVHFGLVIPNIVYNATGNENSDYNITVNSGSCDLNFYINGTDLLNTTLNSRIDVGNISWSNSTDDFSKSYNLSSASNVLKLNVAKNTNFTTWYWLSVPPVYAGYYNGSITITGVESE